jgi:hypothetical protein
MNTLTFKYKDVFTLNIEGETYYCLFLKFAPISDLLIFINVYKQKVVHKISLKTIKDKYQPKIVDLKDTPEDFQKLYKKTFFSIKINSKVSFEFENNIYHGTVIKGGRNIKVSFFLNGENKIVKGPAHQFSLST